jgi:hypothetical protein
VGKGRKQYISYLKLEDILDLVKLLLISMCWHRKVSNSRSVLACIIALFRLCRTCSKTLHAQLRIHVPGSELLEALLVVRGFLAIFIGQADAAGTEAADGAGGRDQSWHGVESV